MIGIDLVENERIASDLERIAKRILSEAEYIVYKKLLASSRKIEYVASRFAAKEAIYKALGGNYGYGYQDFSILNDTKGQPFVINKVDKKINISISHTKNYSIAICQIDK